MKALARAARILAFTTAAEGAAVVLWFLWMQRHVSRVSDRCTREYGTGVPGDWDAWLMKRDAAREIELS